MANYNQSTRDRIADINRGLIVQTGTKNNTDVLKVAAVNIFKVTGRIRILSLDIEAVTAFSNDATVPKWQYDSDTPAGAAFDISAASLTTAQLAVGKRVSFQGTALNTALAIDANAGATLQTPNTMDIGTIDGVGHLGIVGGVAQTSGTCNITILYIPLTPGAAVVSEV